MECIECFDLCVSFPLSLVGNTSMGNVHVHKCCVVSLVNLDCYKKVVLCISVILALCVGDGLPMVALVDFKFYMNIHACTHTHTHTHNTHTHTHTHSLQ